MLSGFSIETRKLLFVPDGARPSLFRRTLRGLANKLEAVEVSEVEGRVFVACFAIGKNVAITYICIKMSRTTEPVSLLFLPYKQAGV